MRLYLTAKTSIPDLFIDYIQVKLKSGEEVSLNWDYSDIERTSSGFSARYKGVYFDEEHANGRIDELQDMKITDIGVYYESKHEQDTVDQLLCDYYDDPTAVYLREIAKRIDNYEVSQRILVCESLENYLNTLERFAKK